VVADPNDPQEVQNWKQILHEVLEKLQDAEAEVEGREQNEEIIAKTREMKELQKVNQFEPVRTELLETETD